MVDRVPVAFTSSSMQLSTSNVSDSDHSWESSLFDRFLGESTNGEEEEAPVIIPASVLQNTPIYDNPFEPTPIREPWMAMMTLPTRF